MVRIASHIVAAQKCPNRHHKILYDAHLNEMNIEENRL